MRVFDSDKIIKTAKSHVDDEGYICVESAEYDALIGVGATEGEAWKVFFELLSDALEAAEQGRLSGFTSVAARELGRRGRAVNSDLQKQAARENGKKGGRPKKKAG